MAALVTPRFHPNGLNGLFYCIQYVRVESRGHKLYIEPPDWLRSDQWEPRYPIPKPMGALVAPRFHPIGLNGRFYCSLPVN
jgi:hypothetical protein